MTRRARAPRRTRVEARDPAERRAALLALWDDGRCQSIDFEADPDDVRAVAEEFLENNPDAEDEDVYRHVRSAAQEIGFTPAWMDKDCFERAKMARATECIVAASVEAEEQLPDAWLEALRDEVEEAASGRDPEEKWALAFEDPRPEPEYWTPWDLVCWRRDTYVLTHGIEAFEEERQELLDEWIAGAYGRPLSR